MPSQHLPSALITVLALCPVGCATDRAASRATSAGECQEPGNPRGPVAEVAAAEQADAQAARHLLKVWRREKVTGDGYERAMSLDAALRRRYPFSDLDGTATERLVQARAYRKALLQLSLDVDDMQALVAIAAATDELGVEPLGDGALTGAERQTLLEHAPRMLIRPKPRRLGPRLQLLSLMERQVAELRTQSASRAVGPPTPAELNAATVQAALDSDAPDVRMLRRLAASPCYRAQRNIITLLKTVHVAEESHRAEFDIYVPLDDINGFSAGETPTTSRWWRPETTEGCPPSWRPPPGRRASPRKAMCGPSTTEVRSCMFVTAARLPRASTGASSSLS